MSMFRFRARTIVAGALFSAVTVAWAQNAAIVNSKPIPKSKVDEFVQALAAQGRPDTPELRTAIREELIARELFVQEAERNKLDRSADVQRQLDQMRQELLIRAVISKHLKTNPVTEQELKTEYEKAIKGQGGDKEFKARHILVEKEEDAKKVIADLKKGGKFEELAKQSKDTGSAANGGDLDWNVPGTFVKPFADALASLEKGRFTETPVKTQFGWHVIQLDDVREMKAPPIEQVAPQLRQELERKRIQELQQSLRAKARIQ